MDEPLRILMRRQDVPGTARFLTFSCYRRLRLFDNDRIKDRFVERMAMAIDRHGVALLAWVVMPEHVHLVVYAEDGAVLRPFLQTLKDPFARQVIGRWRALDAAVLPRLRAKTGSTHFWQAGGGYDRNVVGKELIEKIRYVIRMRSHVDCHRTACRGSGRAPRRTAGCRVRLGRGSRSNSFRCIVPN